MERASERVSSPLLPPYEQPLSLTIPPSTSPHPFPQPLHLSLLILPPSQTPFLSQPLQRYPDGSEDTDIDLPELFLGTLVIEVDLLGKDDSSRTTTTREEWEELRRRCKREEIEWGKKMKGEGE